MKYYAESVDITPRQQFDQGAGTKAERVRVEDSPSEPLEANLLMLWPDSAEDPLLILTFDLLYPGRELRTAIERVVTPLPPERLFIAASHTHRAPMTDGSKPLLGRADSRYISTVIEQLTPALLRALNHALAEEGDLDVGQGTASHSINRRRHRWLALGAHPRWNVILRAPNRRGTVDESLLLLTVRNKKGHPVAHLWNYACHPVAHPDPLGNSSHFIHYVRKALRESQNAPALPVLFLQGFSGDTRPTASVGVEGWQSLILRVLNGARFRDAMKPDSYRDWCASLAACVLALASQQTRFGAEKVSTLRIERAGENFAEGLESTVKFHRLSFGSLLDIVGVSGEVVSAYAGPTRNLSSATHVMCAGCIDDTFGYIPTRKMIEEGGYEGHDFCAEFGLGALSADLENEMNSALNTLFQSESSSGEK